ncbi:MAG: protein translocase subunit SecD [Candidatus Omnitrophica bacterium]|nr:protein translocase subunit SecD [Candidatus Omnitrophota bacterium]
MVPRNLTWRVPLIAVVMAVCLYYAIPPFDTDGSGPKQGKIKLGLDLLGGMHLVLRVDTSKLTGQSKEDAPLRAMEIIRNRIDQFGVAEPTIQRQGLDRMVLQLPGITDRERALELIGKTALLEFKLVSDDSELFKQAAAGSVPEGYRLYDTEDGQKLLLENETLLTGKHIVNAAVNFEAQFNEPVVTLEFDGEGAKVFSDVTGSNVGRRLAIVLDEKVQSAPVINERIPSGQAQITGRFSIDEANDLAIALRAGALPAPILIEEERSVGASLGKDSVDQGIRAALVGFALVVAFMAVYYLFAGVVANLALFLNILILLGFLAYFRATLTLPGIAGVVLTIGMAVDANVLIFERIREELALKKPLSGALAAGYKKAFVTILDSNLTTLITAIILYYIGSGPVRGFALTLGIGIVASMFTAIFVTRAVFDLLLAKGGLQSLPMLHFLRRTPRINFLKYRKLCYVLSLLVVFAGLAAFVKRGPGMFGVDFLGGTLQEYSFKRELSVEKIRESLAKIGYGTAIIQRVAGSGHVIIRSPLGSEKAVSEKIKSDFPDNPYEVLRVETVGPIVGRELKQKALWAFLGSLFAIWAYVVWRFDFRFAFGAILSLLHDGLVTVGFVALTGRELSITVLAAVLTILGYSINDTIVIFDRIRERRRGGMRETFEETINTSVNQTLSRTILTSLTVLMVVAALYFYGGEVINDFAFTMLVGLISGTYSTVYIAAPVLVDWKGFGHKRS